MANLVTTYQNIADILSYTSSRDYLENTLSNSSFNWDNIVIEGSKHLVLPAIYCRLKAKELTHLLPEELDTYLKEITMLNRNRNSEILSQTATLSELLKAHNIAHVFLKGAALISGNYYDDFAERMIGDIDILIPPNQLDLAFQLLKEHAFIDTATELEQFKTIFRNKEITPQKRIKWIGSTKELQWFIKELMYESQKIVDLKNDIWLITASCFVDKNGKEFMDSQLRTASGKRLKRKDQLVQIVQLF